MGGHGEGQAHIHAGAVALDGGIEKLLDLGEGDDLVELGFDLVALHPEDGTVQKNVLAPGQLGVETGADFEQAGDAAFDRHAAFGGLSDAAEDFQQGAFPGSVPANDADHLAAADLEGHIFQGPEFLDFVALNNLFALQDVFGFAGEFFRAACKDIPEGGVFLACGALVADEVGLAEILYCDDGISHGGVK